MLRALAHFFLIGGLLFALRTGLRGAEPAAPEISVEVPADAGEAELERAVRQAILLREARKNEWDLRDPIVFGHLVRNMRFIEGDSQEDDLALFRRAVQMQMHERDPLVKARLLQRARAALGHVPEEAMPNQEELRAHRQRYRERFEREGEVRLEHVFLSRSRRQGRLSSDAAKLAQQLSEDSLEQRASLGDPLPGLRPVQSLRPSQWRASYGEPFVEALAEAELQRWHGPVSSVYGLHFIRLLKREDKSLPPLARIEAEVRADFLADKARVLAEQRMEALRDAYVVHVRRRP